MKLTMEVPARSFSKPSPHLHRWAGYQFGSFRLAREIACGGMASIYLAHIVGSRSVGRTAAVKVIHPHLSAEREFVEMFLDEARIASSVIHPNVCRVLTSGKAHDTYYLAMDYIPGETFGAVLARMQATPEARPAMHAIIAHVLSQCCEGLHAAHEAQDEQGTPLEIVHRDVSPDNIIIGYDGQVRLLDFGIASAAEKIHSTLTGTLKGRFAYMAPERMRELDVDRRADVWSLGVVMWESLAGERLFKRSTWAETVLAVTCEAIPSLRKGQVEVPPALTRIVEKALRTDPSARYETAYAMGKELASFARSVYASTSLTSEWMHRLFSAEIESQTAMLRTEAMSAEQRERGQRPSDRVSIDKLPAPEEPQQAPISTAPVHSRSQSGVVRRPRAGNANSLRLIAFCASIVAIPHAGERERAQARPEASLHTVAIVQGAKHEFAAQAHAAPSGQQATELTKSLAPSTAHQWHADFEVRLSDSARAVWKLIPEQQSTCKLESSESL